MNMSDQVPALIQLVQILLCASSHPPDPCSSRLCTLKADPYGLHHQSSSPSAFLIKLQRIYSRGCLVSRVQILGCPKRKNGGRKERSGCLLPHLLPCLTCLSLRPQFLKRGTHFEVSSSSQDPVTLSPLLAHSEWLLGIP